MYPEQPSTAICSIYAARCKSSQEQPNPPKLTPFALKELMGREFSNTSTHFRQDVIVALIQITKGCQPGYRRGSNLILKNDHSPMRYRTFIAGDLMVNVFFQT
jgi:hypothetical protein